MRKQAANAATHCIRWRLQAPNEKVHGRPHHFSLSIHSCVPAWRASPATLGSASLISGSMSNGMAIIPGNSSDNHVYWPRLVLKKRAIFLAAGEMAIYRVYHCLLSNRAYSRPRCATDAYVARKNPDWVFFQEEQHAYLSILTKIETQR